MERHGWYAQMKPLLMLASASHCLPCLQWRHLLQLYSSLLCQVCMRDSHMQAGLHGMKSDLCLRLNWLQWYSALVRHDYGGGECSAILRRHEDYTLNAGLQKRQMCLYLSAWRQHCRPLPFSFYENAWVGCKKHLICLPRRIGSRQAVELPLCLLYQLHATHQRQKIVAVKAKNNARGT